MQKKTVHVTTKKFGILRESLGTGCRGGGRPAWSRGSNVDRQAQGSQLPSTGATTDATGHTGLVTVLSAVEGDSETRTLESLFCWGRDCRLGKWLWSGLSNYLRCKIAAFATKALEGEQEKKQEQILLENCLPPSCLMGTYDQGQTSPSRQRSLVLGCWSPTGNPRAIDNDLGTTGGNTAEVLARSQQHTHGWI